MFTPITTVIVGGLNEKLLIVTFTVVVACAAGVRAAANPAAQRADTRRTMASVLVWRKRCKPAGRTLKVANKVFNCAQTWT